MNSNLNENLSKFEFSQNFKFQSSNRNSKPPNLQNPQYWNTFSRSNTKEEGLQIRLGTNWRFARNPSLCLSLTQYDSLGFFGVKFLFSRFNLVRFWTAAKDSEYTNKDLEEIQVLVRSAARDCVPQERNSIVSFQASTGVEVWFHGLIFFFVSQF